MIGELRGSAHDYGLDHVTLRPGAPAFTMATGSSGGPILPKASRPAQRGWAARSVRRCHANALMAKQGVILQAGSLSGRAFEKKVRNACRRQHLEKPLRACCCISEWPCAASATAHMLRHWASKSLFFVDMTFIHSWRRRGRNSRRGRDRQRWRLVHLR
jgi:hypothetical protein